MEILNKQKIAALASEIGEENVPVLLDIFLGELDMYIAELSDATKVDKAEYLREISHALKSSAASFGADALCDKAKELDMRAKQGQDIDIVHDVVAMIDQLSSTSSAYRDWKASM